MARSSRELLAGMLQTEQARFAELTEILAQRETRIAQLEAQVRALEANAGRPVRRQDPPAIRELPRLEPDPETGRAQCPLNEEHGSVSPNVRGTCPKCFTEAVRLAALAKRPAAENEPAVASA